MIIELVKVTLLIDVTLLIVIMWYWQLLQETLIQESINNSFHHIFGEVEYRVFNHEAGHTVFGALVGLTSTYGYVNTNGGIVYFEELVKSRISTIQSVIMICAGSAVENYFEGNTLKNNIWPNGTKSDRKLLCEFGIFGDDKITNIMKLIYQCIDEFPGLYNEIIRVAEIYYIDRYISDYQLPEHLILLQKTWITYLYKKT